MADNGEQGCGGVDGVRSESEPLIPPPYLLFRQGRQPQNAGGWSVCSRLILPVFKVVFCSLGLWGHQKWNYIPRVLFVMSCLTQAGYQISVDWGCPYFDCSYFSKTHHNKTEEFPKTRRMCFTMFSLAAFFSYSIFLVCLTASRSTVSSMMSPCKSMADVVDRKEITLLFFIFIIIMASFLSGMVLLFSVQLKSNDIQDNLKSAYAVIAAAVVLTHWASFNTCHVFAISSLSLGKYSVLKHFFFERAKAYVIAFILEENEIRQVSEEAVWQFYLNWKVLSRLECWALSTKPYTVSFNLFLWARYRFSQHQSGENETRPELIFPLTWLHPVAGIKTNQEKIATKRKQMLWANSK